MRLARATNTSTSNTDPIPVFQGCQQNYSMNTKNLQASPFQPRPEVYRLAAKLTADNPYSFTCQNLERACKQLGLGADYQAMYSAQFKAAFGAYVPGTVWIKTVDGNSPLSQGVQTSISDHPFWGREPTPERQQCRTLALLFMANICENPCHPTT